MLDKSSALLPATMVVEEFPPALRSRVLSFTDGKVVKPMENQHGLATSKVNDHDTGLNTGGMGTKGLPNPIAGLGHCCRVHRKSASSRPPFRPERRGLPLQGPVCTSGLMLTPDGPWA